MFTYSNICRKDLEAVRDPRGIISARIRKASHEPYVREALVSARLE